MNYYPIGSGGSNLKYYVDGEQKKLRGYKVYNIPPVFDSSQTTGSANAIGAVVCNNHIHFFKGDTHQKVTDNGVEWLAKLPATVDKGAVYSFDGKIHFFYGTFHYVFNENTNTWVSRAVTPVHGSTTTKSVIVGSALGDLYIQDTNSNYRTYWYKWDKANDTWSSMSPALPMGNECTGIVEVDGKVCVLYSWSSDLKKGYYLNNGTWTEFSIGSNTISSSELLHYSSGNPHCLIFQDSTRREYEITLNGLNFIRGVEPLASRIFLVVNDKIHGVGYQENFPGHARSHVMFDDDGKGYFQENTFEPVMIPIFS